MLDPVNWKLQKSLNEVCKKQQKPRLTVARSVTDLVCGFVSPATGSAVQRFPGPGSF